MNFYEKFSEFSWDHAKISNLLTAIFCQQKMGMALSRPFGLSSMLEKIYKISLEEKELCKNRQHSSREKYLWKMGVPFWMDNHAWQNIQKYLCKNIHPFSCNNLLNTEGILKWALPCHAPRDEDPASTIHLWTLLMHINVLQKKWSKNT